LPRLEDISHSPVYVAVDAVTLKRATVDLVNNKPNDKQSQNTIKYKSDDSTSVMIMTFFIFQSTIINH